MSISDIIKPDRELIVGTGSALIDMLVHETDEFLEKTGAVKGGMTLVEREFIDDTLAMTNSEPLIVPGGSACNTVVGIGKLGGPARFIGKCGKGEMGDFYKSVLKKHHVEPILFTSSLSTGRVLSIITPDAQRSMFTYLGASSETIPEDFTTSCFQNAAIVHIEGYLLFNRDLIVSILEKVKESGAAISLDLASFTVVEESKDILDQIIVDYVDILIANEDEAFAFTGYSDETKAIESMSNLAEISILKIGKKGSTIANGGKILSVEPMGAGNAVDTTGAGDLWASGFLFGLVRGYPLEKCGSLASACGYEVCQVMGATIPEDGWQRIGNMFDL